MEHDYAAQLVGKEKEKVVKAEIFIVSTLFVPILTLNERFVVLMKFNNL